MNYFSFLKKKNKEIQFEQYPTSAHIGKNFRISLTISKRKKEKFISI